MWQKDKAMLNSMKALPAGARDQPAARRAYAVTGQGKRWALGFVAVGWALGCGDGCPHSMTILWVPEDRLATVSSVVATDGCGVEYGTDCDGGCAYFYIRKLGNGDCHVTVTFNDGSPSFKADGAMDPNGCLLPQPIYVPEK